MREEIAASFAKAEKSDGALGIPGVPGQTMTRKRRLPPRLACVLRLQSFSGSISLKGARIDDRLAIFDQRQVVDARAFERNPTPERLGVSDAHA